MPGEIKKKGGETQLSPGLILQLLNHLEFYFKDELIVDKGPEYMVFQGDQTEELLNKSTNIDKSFLDGFKPVNDEYDMGHREYFNNILLKISNYFINLGFQTILIPHNGRNYLGLRPFGVNKVIFFKNIFSSDTANKYEFLIRADIELFGEETNFEISSNINSDNKDNLNIHIINTDEQINRLKYIPDTREYGNQQLDFREYLIKLNLEKMADLGLFMVEVNVKGIKFLGVLDLDGKLYLLPNYFEKIEYTKYSTLRGIDPISSIDKLKIHQTQEPPKALTEDEIKNKKDLYITAIQKNLEFIHNLIAKYELKLTVDELAEPDQAGL
jgi:hypothetical protein